jgi:membrane glycosyltransferase
MAREFLHKPWEKVANRRRLLLLCLILIPTVIASGFMAQVLPRRGAAVSEFFLVFFFAILYAWISIGFWASVAGFFTLLRRHNRFIVAKRSEKTTVTVSDQVRTAILIPVYNEAVDRVFAGLYATYRSLQQAGHLNLFDFYILSDSTDPDKLVEEEAAWHELCQSVDGKNHIFYRNRRVNLKRKSGNVADFCRRWGYQYRYMIVFDADSIMSGFTLFKMVEVMEQRPTIGILQTLPRAVNAKTMFGRLQQFANHLYGPIFSAGLHFWQLGDAQYWGHNAIIRVEPFMKHCGLPRLSGNPPLGGEILSHDFVEAALMRRAGWGVWLDYELDGSYEEMPPTLLDELKRDRRWCQGNMQHLRLFFTRGLFPAHRALFLAGAMAYVSGLLWFLFLCLSTVEAMFEAIVPPTYFPTGRALFPEWPIWNPGWAITLGISTAILLFLPKLLSILIISIKQRRSKQFGGIIRLLLSTIIEVILSALVAPIRMIFHTKFVFSILAGRKVGWTTQQREDFGTSWSEALRFHGTGMALGLIWSTAVLLTNPSFFWWLTPILVALILSVPLSVWSSRSTTGEKFHKLGLLLTPQETDPAPELRWVQSYQQEYGSPSSPLSIGKDQGFVRAVVDPCVHALHKAFLRKERKYSPAIRERRRALVEKALSHAPDMLSPQEKKELLYDPSALASLHKAVWASDDETLVRMWGLAPLSASPLPYGFSIAPPEQDLIAYFSMEIALQESIPTYSGGLGVLAGDTIKSFADIGMNVIAVTLLSERGYFYQRIDESGNQIEYDNIWSAKDFMTRLDYEIEVTIQERPVFVTAWVYQVTGIGGKSLPVLFLDTNLEKNSEEDRQLTSYLYGGDPEYRLKQEIVLGIGGVRILRRLNIHPKKFHMNEGHAAFLTLQLYNELSYISDPYERVERIRGQCSFTTHTPIAAGHDVFDIGLIEKHLSPSLHPEILKKADQNGKINMTLLALVFSGYVNAVSKKHSEVSTKMFPQYSFDYITNGVHGGTWINGHLAQVLDRYGIEWKTNSFDLRNAMRIPLQDIKEAHSKAKKELIDYVNVNENAGFQYDWFTIGFARRMTAYKRADLLFTDPETLWKIDKEVGKLQIIYAGKAHRMDDQGKQIIRGLYNTGKSLQDRIRIVFVEDFNMQVARLMTAGVDLWLNTPKRPLEACGTSGMKAAHNGVPSLSIPDGWWIEGCLEGVTGWAIGEESVAKVDEEEDEEQIDAMDAASLYDKLEKVIIPLFYDNEEGYLQVMRSTIAINASYFNSTRMAKQYLVRAYAGSSGKELLQLVAAKSLPR